MRVYQLRQAEGQTHLDSDELSIQELLISVCFGIFNVSFAMIELVGEAFALKIKIPTYTFMCLNGRIGFVPHVARIKEEEFRQKHMIEKPLDLENMSGKVCLINFNFDYKFEDQSALILCEAIQAMPIERNIKLMPIIIFGETLEDVEMNSMFQMLKSCQNRVNAQIDKVKEIK